MSNRRGRAGHLQRRVAARVVRTRPLPSTTTGHRTRPAERSRSTERSRPRFTGSRARRLESAAVTSSHTRSPSARLVAGAKDSAPEQEKGLSTQHKTVTRMERRRAIRRRRARIIWVVCGAFCLLVLATSFPAQALLRQRSAINASSAELDRLTAGNKQLQSEATELSNPANIAALARSDYDMVSPGETAYDVLPSVGTEQASSKGHSSLNQSAVAPGSSESQALLGDAGSSVPRTSISSSGSGGTGPTATNSSGTNPSGTNSTGTNSSGTGSSGAQRTSGLWGRVLDTLEFWR
jgi:cell division protein FtsB